MPNVLGRRENSMTEQVNRDRRMATACSLRDSWVETSPSRAEYEVFGDGPDSEFGDIKVKNGMARDTSGPVGGPRRIPSRMPSSGTPSPSRATPCGCTSTTATAPSRVRMRCASRQGIIDAEGDLYLRGGHLRAGSVRQALASARRALSPSRSPTGTRRSWPVTTCGSTSITGPASPRHRAGVRRAHLDGSHRRRRGHVVCSRHGGHPVPVRQALAQGAATLRSQPSA